MVVNTNQAGELVETATEEATATTSMVVAVAVGASVSNRTVTEVTVVATKSNPLEVAVVMPAAMVVVLVVLVATSNLRKRVVQVDKQDGEPILRVMELVVVDMPMEVVVEAMAEVAVILLQTLGLTTQEVQVIQLPPLLLTLLPPMPPMVQLLVSIRTSNQQPQSAIPKQVQDPHLTRSSLPA